jgi:hypothetical protein
MFSGRYGEGLQQMELRREFGDMSGFAKIYLSVGLQGTMQFERAVEEGSPYFRPLALFEVGRRDEAFALAYDHATEGYPENLFYLFNRAGRSEDVVGFLEERWPNIAAFAAENRGDAFGYSIMAEVALAYSRAGNQARFDEAMAYIDQHSSKLSEQGVDNFIFSSNRAIQYALLGDKDAALVELQQAAANGWATRGVPEDVFPAFAILVDDPRFQEIEATMLATMNRDRTIVGLEPLNEEYRVGL